MELRQFDDSEDSRWLQLDGMVVHRPRSCIAGHKHRWMPVVRCPVRSSSSSSFVVVRHSSFDYDCLSFVVVRRSSFVIRFDYNRTMILRRSDSSAVQPSIYDNGHNKHFRSTTQQIPNETTRCSQIPHFMIWIIVGFEANRGASFSGS